MMRNQFALGLAFTLSATSVVVAQSNKDQTEAPTKKRESNAAVTRMSDGDRTVLIHHHGVNAMEIDMGQLALQHGGAAVKKYATGLIRDHQNADRVAMSLAKLRGVELQSSPLHSGSAPRGTGNSSSGSAGSGSAASSPADHDHGASSISDNAMYDKHEAMMSRLRTLDGNAFDREFLQAMIDGHSTELSYLNTAVVEADDAKLKAHLTQTRPVIERHIRDARTLLNELAAHPANETGTAVSPHAAPTNRNDRSTGSSRTKQ